MQNSQEANSRTIPRYSTTNAKARAEFFGQSWSKYENQLSSEAILKRRLESGPVISTGSKRDVTSSPSVKKSPIVCIGNVLEEQAGQESCESQSKESTENSFFRHLKVSRQEVMIQPTDLTPKPWTSSSDRSGQPACTTPKMTKQLTIWSVPSPLVRGVTSSHGGDDGIGRRLSALPELNSREPASEDSLSRGSEVNEHNKTAVPSKPLERRSSVSDQESSHRLALMASWTPILLTIILLPIGLLLISVASPKLDECPYSEGIPILTLIWGCLMILLTLSTAISGFVHRRYPEKFQEISSREELVSNPAKQRSRSALILQSITKILVIFNLICLLAAIVLLIVAYNQADDEWPSGDETYSTNNFRSHNYHTYYTGGSAKRSTYYCDSLLYDTLFYFTVVVIFLFILLTGTIVLLLCYRKCCNRYRNDYPVPRSAVHNEDEYTSPYKVHRVPYKTPDVNEV